MWSLSIKITKETEKQMERIYCRETNRKSKKSRELEHENSCTVTVPLLQGCRDFWSQCVYPCHGDLLNQFIHPSGVCLISFWICVSSWNSQHPGVGRELEAHHIRHLQRLSCFKLWNEWGGVRSSFTGICFSGVYAESCIKLWLNQEKCFLQNIT